MQFLYYRPAVKEITAECFATAGLGYAIRQPMMCAETRGGPSHPGDPPGPPGVVCAPGNKGVFAWRPSGQKWEPIDGTDMWVGYQLNDPPKVSELAREQQLVGKNIKLGDGQSWLIPVARQWTQEGEDICYVEKLPKSMKYAEGKWQMGDVIPEYRELWEYANKFWDGLASATVSDDNETVATLDWDGEINAFVSAVKANYYVGPQEASLLQLPNPITVGLVLSAMVELDNFEELIKKKLLEADISSSDSGQRVDSLDTVPA